MDLFLRPIEYLESQWEWTGFFGYLIAVVMVPRARETLVPKASEPF